MIAGSHRQGRLFPVVNQGETDNRTFVPCREAFFRLGSQGEAYDCRFARWRRAFLWCGTKEKRMIVFKCRVGRLFSVEKPGRSR